MSQALQGIPTYGWVVLLTLPVLAPLARSGFFESHDGVFHVYRLAALDRAVRAGALYPRWFPEFAFGYGHPVLNFYGPLSYYWGLPFTLVGLDAALAMKLVLATALIASALGMYLFTRLYWERGPALLAAVLYAYLPYHLVDLYVRGAVAEFLAFVWFPLVLWAFHRLVAGPDRRGGIPVALVALLLSALVLTHNLSAFLFAPVLGGYVALLLLKQRDRRATGWMVLALGLTVLLTAFYWLPVLAESQYVGLGQAASQGYRDHLLALVDVVSWSPVYSYALEPGVPLVFPLGWVQAIVLVAALLLPFCLRRHRTVILLFLVVAYVSAFMLSTASLLLWQAFERVLIFFQYPWRFQALTALSTAFLAGALWTCIEVRLSRFAPYLLFVSCGLLLAWSLWRLPVTPGQPELSVEGMWGLDRRLGQIGATWTGEFLPTWVEEQRANISHAAPGPMAIEAVLPAGQFRLEGVGHTRYDLHLDAAHGAALVLHQFHYPGWLAAWQGEAQASSPRGGLGLAAFDLSPGSGSLVVRLGHTLAQWWGTLISLVTALVIGVVLIARHQLSPGRRSRRAWFLAAGYLFLVAVLLAGLVLPNGYVRAVTPANANLEDTVELLAFATDETTYHPGEAVGVTLYWRALRGLDQDYKTFVHLTDVAVTRQPAQHDGDPGGGATPTTRWLPGELVPDTHHLTLPPDLPPGRYRLWAGMYEYETVRNLAVFSAEVTAVDDRILLGDIKVVAP